MRPFLFTQSVEAKKWFIIAVLALLSLTVLFF